MRRWILNLLILLVAVGASVAQDWPAPQDSEKILSRLDNALTGLRELGELLGSESVDSSSAKLEEMIPGEGVLSGLGIQLLKRRESVAWAGWSFPVDGASHDSLMGPVMSFRSYGVFRILSLSLPGPVHSETTWILDLPLLRTDGVEEPGPATLWGPRSKFGILPMEGGRIELAARDSWTTLFRGDESGVVLEVAGRPFLRLHARSDSGESTRSEASSALLWLALPFLLAAFLLILGRSRRPKLSFWATVSGLFGGALLLRGSMILARPGGALFDSAQFAFPGLGGLLASPGDFLASAFVLFISLFLLGHLFVEKDRLVPRPLAFALALILPLTALTLGWSLASKTMANVSGDILFDGLLPSPVAAVVFLGIFFLQLSLMLLIFPLSRRVLRNLTAGKKITSLTLLLLVSAVIWRSAPMLLAAFFMGLAIWAPSSRQSRGVGVLWLLLPLVLSLGFLSQDALERQQDAYLSVIKGDHATGNETQLSQRLLLRRILGGLAADREIRGLLASGERLDDSYALSIWKRSPLARLGSEGALAVYDARGSLSSSYSQGRTPQLPDEFSSGGRGPELRLREIEGDSDLGRREYLRGEIALLDAIGAMGVLVLDLPAEPCEIFTPESLTTRGYAARLMAALSRISLYLAVLIVLVGVELLFTATGIYPRSSAQRTVELGFQARLLASFLLVALLPAALIGLLGAREMLRQMEDGSERAAMQRVQAARSLLESQVRQEAQDLARSEYVKSFVVDDPMFVMAPRDIGAEARNQIMIFDGHGNIRLDEILRDFDQAEVDSFLAFLPKDQVVYERTGSDLYAGLLLDPPLRHRGARVPLSVFYRMKIGKEQVVDLAAGIGGDLSLYRGGTLLHSSSDELFGLGRVSPRLRMSSLAALEASLDPDRTLLERDDSDHFLRALLALPGADGEPAGVLSSQDPQGGDVREMAFRQATGQVFALASLLLLLALALGGWLSRRIFGPIRRLQLGTRRVAAGDFSERLAETGSDEIGELVSSFNLMTDRLEDAQREIVRKKRLEAWSEMARQVAHEIKNPLTPIKLSVQYMERAWRDKKPGFDDIFADTVKTLYEQVDILRRIARDFSSFGRSQKLQITSVDLPGLAAEVLAPYAGALAIEITELEVLAVKADREALRKIILNLVENAREAMDAGGRLDVSWRRESGGGELSIRDHGSGIPEDLLDKLFEPYFSTKTSGTGLGLAISAQLCDEMNGRLRLMNHPEGGALSVLWLPEAADD